MTAVASLLINLTILRHFPHDLRKTKVLLTGKVNLSHVSTYSSLLNARLRLLSSNASLVLVECLAVPHWHKFAVVHSLDVTLYCYTPLPRKTRYFSSRTTTWASPYQRRTDCKRRLTNGESVSHDFVRPLSRKTRVRHPLKSGRAFQPLQMPDVTQWNSATADARRDPTESTSKRKETKAKGCVK
jgi:hypothetical protein